MTRTVGVEEEFLLAQRESPYLAAEGGQVVARAEQATHGRFDKEFMQQQAELGSAPHEDIGSLHADLRARRAELAEAARARGVRLLASATSPLDQRVTTTADARYERMIDMFGRLAQMQLACGMHVHVSIDSPEEGVAVLDRIRGWLPVLLALSANSPFLAGRDTDYASYRSVLWGQWPTAGAADVFGSIEGYERARAALISSGAALDEAMICFDARLSARYPTVEIRVCDVCADVRDAATIAALARALVSTVADQAADGMPVPAIRSELIRATSWRAARWGVEEQLVDPASGALVPAWELVGELLAMVEPALKSTGDDELVRTGLARIRERGSGARLQRDAFARGGIDAVVEALVEQTTA
ncbi:glutamate--cysteine ligase [Nocardioides sp. BP30]|uniref:carboxylate-amine ligase n=1 Tax=Nocardioides sp. BP30 TaxID=3036374 RepID=UPI0024682BB2|nr:glutamate--cysteine ligase [Nocardioides sp. BP30]WGL51331.1 glutamate--cysteine ligase [Nocardioides sp. BP30]